MQWCWQNCRIYLISLNWVGIRAWMMNIYKFGSKESWPVWRYFPCICRGKKTWKSSIIIVGNPAEFRLWDLWNKVSTFSPTEVSLPRIMWIGVQGNYVASMDWQSAIDFVYLFINYVSCIPMEAIWHQIWRVAHCQWRVGGHDTGNFELYSHFAEKAMCTLSQLNLCSDQDSNLCNASQAPYCFLIYWTILIQND
jgi:hypothetical protein